MPLNHLQAQEIARIICGLRKDFPPGPVIAALTSDNLMGYTPLQIITAAFMAANDERARTIQVITQKLADLTASETWAGEKPSIPPFTPGFYPLKEKPRQPHAVLPLRAPRCPAHDWESAEHCAACRSEILTGERHPDAYGVKDAA